MANVPLKSITFPGLANKYIIPQVDNTLTQQGCPADAKKVGDEITSIKEDLSLLADEIPNTIQTYTFSNGQVSQITHTRNNSAVRIDVFVYGETTITETRTLITGDALTITTNLETLETSVVYTAA